MTKGTGTAPIAHTIAPSPSIWSMAKALHPRPEPRNPKQITPTRPTASLPLRPLSGVRSALAVAGVQPKAGTCRSYPRGKMQVLAPRPLRGLRHPQGPTDRKKAPKIFSYCPRTTSACSTEWLPFSRKIHFCEPPSLRKETSLYASLYKVTILPSCEDFELNA
jgi:hypothetical protein